jgi:hypothetical protein
MSLGGDFSAFHRNKKGRRSPTSADSSIDFRFRNAEKWFDERRSARNIVTNKPTVTNKSPPPGLKRGAKYVDFWELDELRIPPYDKFDYIDRESNITTENLLPEWWHTSKWTEHSLEELRSAWFHVPPKIQEGDCVDMSLDLPVLIYQSGASAVDSLPFVDLLQQGFYMDVFQQYYHMFMITNSIYKN